MNTPPSNDQIALFKGLFQGRVDCYGSYFRDTGKYHVRKDKITDEVIVSHLMGRIPLGVFPLVKDRISFAVVDFDTQQTHPVIRFRRTARALGMTVYVERSKGKGYHGWFFWGDLAPAAQVINTLRALLSSIGYPNTEIFPKQAALKEGEFGNFVNCPLFGELVPMGRTVFVDDEFNPYPDQWEFLKDIQRVPAAILDAAVIGLNEERSIDAPNLMKNGLAVRPVTQISIPRTFGLLPCATRMLNEGVRNMQRNAAFRLAVSLKKAGLPEAATVAVLIEWAAKNKPDDGKGIITTAEIEQQVASAYQKAYAGCGCNDEAVRPFCDERCPLRLRVSA